MYFFCFFFFECCFSQRAIFSIRRRGVHCYVVKLSKLNIKFTSSASGAAEVEHGLELVLSKNGKLLSHHILGDNTNIDALPTKRGRGKFVIKKTQFLD